MKGQSLYNLLEKKLLKNPQKTVFKIKRGFAYTTWTGQEIVTDVNKINNYLKSIGVRKNDKVLIWSPNMPEWSIVFLACLKSGIIVVPVDVRSKWETVENYIKQTNPKLILASRFTYPFSKSVSVKRVILEDLFSKKLPNLDSKKTPAVKPASKHPISILFTSGSTGNPKGVIITEKNVVSQIKQTELILPPIKRYETVSILPLSHAYELFYGLIIPLYKEGTITYLSRINPLTIKRAIKKGRATYLVTVPQFLRVLYENIMFEAEKAKQLNMLNRLLEIAPYFPMGMRKIMFKKIHKTLGNNLEFIACGSAPLEPKIAKKYEAMGFKVVEGYGATETTGIATALNWRKRKFGTVGKPPKYTKIKISNENEILIKGSVVSPGYYKDREKNKESFINGWYKSGDTGYFDKKGNLVISGRLSTRIVMPDGTKVYPEDIERKLNNVIGIKDSCVFGKKQGNNIAIHTYVLSNSIKTTNELEKIIEKVNSKLEFKQQITSFAYWPKKDFPRLRTLKVDRNKVEQSSNKKVERKKVDKKKVRIDFSSVKSIIKTISQKRTISKKDKLEKDLGLDSLKRIQLAALIEENLGIEVNELDLAPTTSVSSLVKMIRESEVTDDKGVFSVDKILDHWRFSPTIKNLRSLVQKFIVFPLHAYFVKIKVIKGKNIFDKLPKQSIMIFNHVGMLDAITVMRLLPPIMVQKSVIPAAHQIWSEGNSFMKNLIDLSVNTYPLVQRGKGSSTSFEIIGELVYQGYSPLFAPEGRMQKERKLQKFKGGLGLMAKEFKLPVIMFKIGNEYWNIWPPPPPGTDAINASGQFLPIGKGTVPVKIGYAKINYNLSYQQITKSIRKQFMKL